MKGNKKMKKSVWEYIDFTVDEKKELWKKCVFVFDTNVFLNLYRCSGKSSEALIGAFRNLSERIWMPHQVAYEYMKNRCKIIFDVCEKYESFENTKKSLLDQARSLSNKNDNENEINQLDNSIDEWLNKTKKNNLRVMNPNEDSILNDILELYSGKTGEAYTQEREEALKKEGEERYKKNIPPGYKDSEKKISVKCDNNAYGDFFVWRQIMDYSENQKKDIIFVTDDIKEDWWFRTNGKTLGPRIELRKEFYNTTNQRFFMYSMDQFMKLYQEEFNQIEVKVAIDELKRMTLESLADYKKIEINPNHWKASESDSLFDKFFDEDSDNNRERLFNYYNLINNERLKNAWMKIHLDNKYKENEGNNE